MPATLIENCGAIVTGDVDEPLADGDAILVADGLIAAIGARSALDVPEGAQRLDARGQTAVPGLIDSHIHPAIGDWTPRMSALGWRRGAGAGTRPTGSGCSPSRQRWPARSRASGRAG
jgi:predicted amidohydrolase